MKKKAIDASVIELKRPNEPKAVDFSTMASPVYQDEIAKIPSNAPDRDKKIHELKVSRFKEVMKSEVEKLSPIYKTLITLYHHEELSYDEIGQITGMPAGTVKSYLFRARKELKNNLLLNYTKEELW